MDRRHVTLSRHLRNGLYVHALMLVYLPWFVTSSAKPAQDVRPVAPDSDRDELQDSLDLQSYAGPAAIDTDGDGLSDFQEGHKYLTDPTKPDSDGDWNERREYTYSVRTILQYMPPFDEDALNDDFQDARVLQKQDDYIELEVIHYPFATAHKSIKENPNWRKDYACMTEYLKPGITTNWDAKMRQDLLAQLKADGIEIDKLSDKEAVEKVSSWLMKKSKSLDNVFITYYVHLYTFNDLSEANLAPTWGWRYGKGERSAVFKHSNPYAAVTLSDLFGGHSYVPNPPVTKQYELSDTAPNIYIMGPSGVTGWFDQVVAIVGDVVANKTGRHHEKKSYDELFIDNIWNRKPADILVLLFALDTNERIPKGYEDLLPKPWSEIEPASKQGKTVELPGKARKMNVILLAAPKREQLNQLITESKLLHALKKRLESGRQ